MVCGGHSRTQTVRREYKLENVSRPPKDKNRSNEQAYGPPITQPVSRTSAKSEIAYHLSPDLPSIQLHDLSRTPAAIVVLPPERSEVPAEVQFEVARNTVTDPTDLGTARLRTGQGQEWEEQVVARLELGSRRRPEPIDLGLCRS